MNIGKLCRVPCVPYAYTHAFVQSLRRVSLMREVFVLGRIKFIGQLLSSAKQQCSKMLCENLFSLMHMTWCVLQFPFVALCSFCEISKYLCVCVCECMCMRVFIYLAQILNTCGIWKRDHIQFCTQFYEKHSTIFFVVLGQGIIQF